MGRQSYILYYNTQEEKDNIISAIKTHNKPTTYEDDGFDEVGEELTNICWCKMKRPYKRGNGMNMDYAILCCNGGGRNDTYSYFLNKSIRISWYNEAFVSRADIKNAIPIKIEQIDACLEVF